MAPTVLSHGIDGQAKWANVQMSSAVTRFCKLLFAKLGFSKRGCQVVPAETDIDAEHMNHRFCTTCFPPSSGASIRDRNVFSKLRNVEPCFICFRMVLRLWCGPTHRTMMISSLGWKCSGDSLSQGDLGDMPFSLQSRSLDEYHQNAPHLTCHKHLDTSFDNGTNCALGCLVFGERWTLI
eukprot:3617373-Amphidinium_carterae.1